MKVLTGDLLASSTITNAVGIDTANGHPIEYIQDQRLSRSAWILPSSLAGDLFGISLYGENPYLSLYSSEEVVIDFDMKSQVNFTTFGLAGNNWNSFSIDLSWSTTDIDVPDGSETFVSTEELYAFTVSLGSQTARYFRMRLYDFTITGNYIIIGRVSLGDLTVLPAIGPIYDPTYESTALQEFSDTRQVYGGPKVIFRTVNVSFPEITTRAELVSLFRTLDLYTASIWVFDEPCLSGEDDLYGVIGDNQLPLAYNEARVTSGRWTITEVY